MTSSQMMLFGGGPPPVTYTALLASLYQTGTSMPACGVAAVGTDIYVSGQNNTNFTCTVTKISSTGTITWQRKISLTGSTGVSLYGSDLIVGNLAADSSGNVYVTGAITNSGSVNDGFLIKYNSSGTLQWQRKINAASGQSVNNLRVAIDSTGADIYISAIWTKSSASATGLVKYNSSGTLQWQRMLFTGSFNNVQASAVRVDSAGNVYLAGQDGVSGIRGFVTKYNNAGTLQWQQYISAASSPNVSYFAFDSSTNIYCSGTPRIFKLNSSGTVQWGYNMSTNNVSAAGIATDSSGNSWGNYDNGASNVTFNKFDTSGTNTDTNTAALTSATASIIAGGCFGDTGYYILAKSIFSSSLSAYTIGVWRLPTNFANTTASSISMTNWSQASYSVGTANSNSSASLSSGANSQTDAAGTFTDVAGSFTDAAGTLSITSATF
jgi:hypothetical protein